MIPVLETSLQCNPIFLPKYRRAPSLAFDFEKYILRGAELSWEELEKDVFFQVYAPCMPVVQLGDKRTGGDPAVALSLGTLNHHRRRPWSLD